MALTHSSCKLEGITYDIEDTHIILKHNLLPNLPKNINDAKRLRDHHRALNYVLKLAENKEELTMNDLQNISSMILKNEGRLYRTANGDFDSSKGHFRRIQVSYGIGERREGVNFQIIPSQISDLLNCLNKEIKKVKGFIEVNKLAFSIQYKIITIHAFGDGNSRLSRLLMNYVQHIHEQPLTILFEKDKKSYWDALYKAQDSGDIGIFQDFMFDQAIKFFDTRIKIHTPNEP